MPIIDDDGNLFGLVNVVDALAALLVLAVVVAGAAFALQSDVGSTRSSTNTVSATLDLGTQPDYVVQALDEGDSYAPDGNSELTVTDVHLTPQGNDTRVLLRVRLAGLSGERTVSYAGAPPRLGRELTVQTDAYTVRGTIRDVNGSASLPTTTTKVLLNTTVPASTARSMDVGDAYRVAGREVATVESLSVYGTQSPDRKRVFVGLSLQTLTRDDRPQFGGTVVIQGATLPFQATDYAVEGTVRRVGATEPRGDPVTRTVTLRVENASPDIADSVRAGMSETSGGETVARITNVERKPATVVLTSDGGQIYEREHPVNQDLTLTAELSVRRTATGLTFKGRTVQHGSTVALDLGSVTVRARVVAL